MTRELSQLETYLVHEFIEDYVDGIMSRRDMVCRVLHITGGVAATATVLTQLGVKSASAQEGTPAPPPTPTGPRSSVSVPEDDPRITASDVTLPRGLTAPRSPPIKRCPLPATARSRSSSSVTRTAG